MDPQSPPMRVGDAERAQVTRVLDQAYAAGQLTHQEHSERTDQALVAVHASDLAPLVADLTLTPPTELAPLPPPRQRVPAPTTSSASGSPVSLAILSAAVKSGDWTLAPQHVAFAFWGAVTIDLREARFASREVTITAAAIMGGIRIVVPPDVRVRVQGIPVLGAVGTGGDPVDPDQLAPDAPVVTVNGVALMGAVEVIRQVEDDD
ncbi:DUF1707 SHOCT-like domain-containing protein [Propionibacteriaceae bacterium Y1923]